MSTLIAKAEMQIRKPAAEVFEAFVDPATITKFWFTKSSGRLEPGRQVTWTWEMYGFSMPVDVKSVELNKRIVIEWPASATPTTVTWAFTERADNTTFVSITSTGFSGDDAQAQAIDSTEGFAFLLAGLKAYLEHGVLLHLVRDRFPDVSKPC